MTAQQDKRAYFPYCLECALFKKCSGPEIVKDPEKHLAGDWEDIKETSCQKFQGEKPAGNLPSITKIAN